MISETLLSRVKADVSLKRLSLKKLTELYTKLHEEYKDWREPEGDSNASSGDGQ